jgi:hypothetical protein
MTVPSALENLATLAKEADLQQQHQLTDLKLFLIGLQQ